jgi:replication factor A1
MSDILDIYEKLGGKITQKEFNKLIEEKMEAMGGLCDERTAALLVAHDQGVESAAAIKIKDISADKKDVEFIGKITEIGQPREFTKKDGKPGRVSNITVADETAEVRIVLWDEQTSVVDNKELKEGDVIRVKGYVKQGQQGVEVNIGYSGRIEPDTETKITVKDTMLRIADIKVGMGNLNTRGVILSRQDPRTFSRKDGSSGSLASMMIGDETGKIRVTVWDTKIQEMEAFQPGATVELLHAYSREAPGGNVEVQVGNRGMIRESSVEAKYEEKVTKIGDIAPDNSYNIKGTVTGIDGVREFTTKDGKPGRLCGVFLSDESGRIRVVFWGELANFAEALSVGDEIIVTDVQARVGMKNDIEMSANWRSTVRKTR